MPKIAVAVNDDCTVADSIEETPSVVVYEIKEQDILSRTIRYYRSSVTEVLEDIEILIGKGCGEDFKKDVSSRGLQVIFTGLDSADDAVAQVLNIKKEKMGPAEQTCRH